MDKSYTSNGCVGGSADVSSRMSELPPTALVPSAATPPLRQPGDLTDTSSTSTSYNFSSSHQSSTSLSRLRAGIIGRNSVIQTPFGERVMVHADAESCGQPLKPLEDYISNYFGTKTNAANAAKHSHNYLRDARDSIAQFVGAPRHEYAVVFAGRSASAATQKMAQLLGVTDTTRSGNVDPALMATLRPVVIHCTTEDPSLAVVWRDIDCQHEVVPSDADGRPDLACIRKVLSQRCGSSLIVGCFSLGCPVTGVTADVRALCRLLHEYGAVATFDYTHAGSTLPVPCVPTDGSRDPAEKIDAVLLSPSMLPGGSGSAGVLVIRKSAIQVAVPERGWRKQGLGQNYTGNPVPHYIADIEQQEGCEGRSLIANMRAGISAQLHLDMGPRAMHRVTSEYVGRAINVLRNLPGVWLLGQGQGGYMCEDRLPIISFNILVRHPDHIHDPERCLLLHQGFVCSILNDVYGIEASTGNAYEGPNGFEHLDRALLAICGHSWEVDFIIRAITDLSQDGWKLLPQYDCDVASGVFTHYTEGCQRHTNSMQQASQRILSSSGIGVPVSMPCDSTTPPASACPARLPIEEASDMSNTPCLSLGGQLSAPKKHLTSFLSSLICGSARVAGVAHTKVPASPPASRSTGDDRPSPDSKPSALSNSAMSTGTDTVGVSSEPSAMRRTPIVEAAEAGAADGPRNSGGNAQLSIALLEPESFVAGDKAIDTEWFHDKQIENSDYVLWAHCPMRWFLMPHEAANTLQCRQSLTMC